MEHTQLPSLVSSLRVVPDSLTLLLKFIGEYRTILLLFLGQESLDSESLARRQSEKPRSEGRRAISEHCTAL